MEVSALIVFSQSNPMNMTNDGNISGDICIQTHESLDADSGENHRRFADIETAFVRAMPLLTETLTLHWGTGQGTRVRHILWSLYTCGHLVNLGEACSGLDRRLAEALATAIAARLIVGPEVERVLREILQNSGEFARFDREEAVTPDHLPVTYPPVSADARTLREMADSLDHWNARAG